METFQGKEPAANPRYGTKGAAMSWCLGKAWDTVWCFQGAGLESEHLWEQAGGSARLPITDLSRTLDRDPALLHRA